MTTTTLEEMTNATYPWAAALKASVADKPRNIQTVFIPRTWRNVWRLLTGHLDIVIGGGPVGLPVSIMDTNIEMVGHRGLTDGEKTHMFGREVLMGDPDVRPIASFREEPCPS